MRGKKKRLNNLFCLCKHTFCYRLTATYTRNIRAFLGRVTKALRNTGTMRKLVPEPFCSAKASISLAYPGTALC